MTPNRSDGPVLLALSGGVDSSTAARLLLDSGAQVHAAYLRLHDYAQKGADDAQAAADALGIPLVILDWRQLFWQRVQAPFRDAWAQGKTPNPCVVCNGSVKFGALLDYALQNGYTALATGHYARLERSGGRTLLLRGLDQKKDQSYFLSRLSQAQLSSALFPLGGYTKPQTRAAAERAGLPSARAAESQDVCFLPDGDYAAWLERTGFSFTPGSFIRADGTVLGPHNGAERLTLGQRRGLGLALGQRSYVTGRRGGDLIVGPESELLRRRVTLTALNYIPFAALTAPLRVSARLRYRHPGGDAWLHPLGPDAALLEFDLPQRAGAPGQTAVSYDGDLVVCGGEISPESTST